METKCVFCRGSGHTYGDPRRPCPLCKGRAVLTLAGNPRLRACPFCQGRSYAFGDPLTPSEVCKGIGSLAENGKPPTIISSDDLPPVEPLPPSGFTIIAPTRLAELRACKPANLDFKKLFRLCEELNTTYSQGCYFAVIMLIRCLLDHVPPAFGKKTFPEVANNYAGGKSFTEAMQSLESSARKIADAHLHNPMRASETLPTPQQVHFGPQLDILLAEIVRITR